MAYTCQKRQRVDFLLPPEIKSAMDDFCRRHDLTRTAFLETLIRQFLKKRKIYVKPAQLHYYDNVDDMPLNP